MKKTIITLFFLNLLVLAFSQSQRWEVHIGLSNRDEGLNTMIESYDKGYHIEGYHVTGWQNTVKGWQVKTNINGNILWENDVIHNSGTFKGKVITVDSSGNRYVGGIQFGLNMPIVVKYNPCGEKLWCIILQDTQYGQGSVTGIVINNNDEVIVSMRYVIGQNPHGVFLAGISMDGVLLWKKQYASKINYPLLVEPEIYRLDYINNEYYLSGFCYWPYPSNPGHVFLRPFFIGIDSLFNEKWILPFYALDSVYGDAYATIPINDTLLMGVGYRVGNGTIKALLMFYTKNGNEVGYSQLTNSMIPGTITTQFRQVERINDTLFMLTGAYEPEYNYFYNMDFITDTSCNLYGYMPRPYAIGHPQLLKTSDNNFLVGTTKKVGSAKSDIYLYKFDQNLQSVPFDTTTYVYDSLCPYPIQSGTIDLSGCMVLTSTDWIPTPKEYYARIRTIPITIYPNPANDNITFALENTEHHRNIELRCFNLLGTLQHQIKVLQGQQQATANVLNWTPGMYIAVVYSDGKPVGRGKFVVQ